MDRMNSFCGRIVFLLSFSVLLANTNPVAFAGQAGNSGAVRGTITDPSGAVISSATIHITSPAGRLDRSATSDENGQFEILNLPFANFRLTATAPGFKPFTQIIEVRSVVGLNQKLVLQVASQVDTVTVDASSDLVETDPSFHTDVDRSDFEKIPLESQSSSLSSLVTLATPGVSADSNGMFHGLGDHASNSFSLDGQSISDQQSKAFSNQLPANAIQSLEVISGAPPAEYGDKTSLVIVATTRSGQGVTRPTGSLNLSYGSFGSVAGGADLSYGGKNWGNFIEVDALQSGRFLDPPEFAVFHDKGNEENFFDRIDQSLSASQSIHLNLNFSRSWFQTPNSYDNLNVQNVVKGGTTVAPVWASVGNADQRSEIKTINIAPTYTLVVNNESVLNLGAYVRRDDYRYLPSANPLADLGPSNLQTASIAQQRTLTNAGVHGDISYAHGVHTFKAGVQYAQTFLREHDQLGVVEATYNAPCVDANGTPVAGLNSPSQCASNGYSSNASYLSALAPYDFTRGGSYYSFAGHTDVKGLALYVEDQIRAGNWLVNLGVRGDVYNGLTSATQAEPRLGVAYNIKRTATVLRSSYARTLETPFNENLVLSSNGCNDAVLSSLLSCTTGVANTLSPGYRNEFHVGLQQGFRQHLVVSGEYIWKYTHNAFDFSVLGNTPITFPINWHNSKIPGFALHVEVPSYHGFEAYSVMSSVAARFLPPQVAGAGATVGQSGYAFRIDHDERFNQTTHVQYTYNRNSWFKGMWAGMNWRFDSGMVAGSTPCYNLSSNDPNTACDSTSTTLNGQPAVNLSSFTADEEFEAGLSCNGVFATPNLALPTVCLASQLGSKYINIPAPGTGNNDRNPARIQSRSLMDLSVGKPNLFHAQRYKLDLDLTAVNLTNKVALYNFLSTFSGTHYVTPRSLTARLTLNF